MYVFTTCLKQVYDITMLEKLPDTEEVQTVEKEIYMIMLEIKEKNSERIE